MLTLDDEDVARLLEWDSLIAAIERVVCERIDTPTRLNYEMLADGDSGHFLVMPAWKRDDLIGLKLITYWPDNETRGLPAVGASYLLLDARAGTMLATFGAKVLTHKRTAAVSCLAAKYLLPAPASSLLIVGTGPVAEQLADAHWSSGRFERIEIYGRTISRAEALRDRLVQQGVRCTVSKDIEASVRRADMIAAATSASVPLIRGDWLRDDAHVDLIGSFTPAMREADSLVMERASQIWVDTMAALEDAGDLFTPLAERVIGRDRICGDLPTLIQRPKAREKGITVFKAIGVASADFAAAKLLYETDHRHCIGHGSPPPTPRLTARAS